MKLFKFLLPTLCTLIFFYSSPAKAANPQANFQPPGGWVVQYNPHAISILLETLETLRTPVNYDLEAGDYLSIYFKPSITLQIGNQEITLEDHSFFRWSIQSLGNLPTPRIPLELRPMGKGQFEFKVGAFDTQEFGLELETDEGTYTLDPSDRVKFTADLVEAIFPEPNLITVVPLTDSTKLYKITQADQLDMEIVLRPSFQFPNPPPQLIFRAWDPPTLQTPRSQAGEAQETSWTLTSKVLWARFPTADPLLI